MLTSNQATTLPIMIAIQQGEQGTSWWNGTAVWWTMANHEFAPLNRDIYRAFLGYLTKHRWLWEIVMLGGNLHTLFVELCFPFLVWHKKLRWIMITVAALMHGGIALLMGLTVFQVFMLCFLVPFFPAETIHRLVDAIRETLGAALPARARAALAPRPAPATVPG